MHEYSMKRCAQVVQVKEGEMDTYKKLHAEIWPDVLKRLKDSHLQNYSIYLRRLPDGNHYLFSYFEYSGDDFDADMARIADDPVTRKWWAVCKPCLIPLPGVTMEECWAAAEEVFHCD